MGNSSWDDDVYTSKSSSRAATGSAFAYSAASIASGSLKVHDKLNPFGVKFRESRDSKEHPNSNAIALVLDVTGSNIGAARVIQKKLGQLMALLLKKSYIEDPQILFAATGDATCDEVPIQVGQYESGIEADESLDLFILEGNGGGQTPPTESYELLMYFMARHTSIDCLEKRGKKGYVFLIGDENPYPKVDRKLVKELIGDNLEADISVEDIAEELREKYETFFIIPEPSSHGRDPSIHRRWSKLFGQNVIKLSDPDAICETIALAIGVAEGKVDTDTGAKDLIDVGADRKMVSVATSALVPYSRSRGSVALVGKVEGELVTGTPSIGKL